MFFPGAVDFLHHGSGFAVHESVVFFHNGIDIGFAVPEDFAQNVEVHGTEHPVVGFGFKEGSEGVGSALFEEAAHSVGGESGNVADSVAALGGVGPEIGFLSQFFVPVGKEFKIFFLDGGIRLFPGTGERQMDDHIVWDGTAGDGFVLGVCHDGDVTGDPVAGQSFGDVDLEVPDQLRDRLIPFGIDRFALGTLAGEHAVVGHDVEKRT